MTPLGAVRRYSRGPSVVTRRGTPWIAQGPDPGAGLVWLLPLLLGLLLYFSPLVSPERIVIGLAALCLIVIASRRPDLALITLIVLLPFQTLLLAKLYAWGVPESVVRPLAGWKEALALGVVVAGVQGFRASRARLDLLDGLALAFVGIAAIYALVPDLFAPDAPVETSVRSLGFRQSAGFVILLLAARHARLPAGFPRRAIRIALRTGIVVAGVALYETVFSSAWNDFVVDDLHFANYQVQVLDVFPLNPLDYRVYGHIGGREIVRAGSVFLDPLNCGFYLLIAFAIGVDRVVRQGARPDIVAALFLIGAGLLVTQTRSALVGALVIVALAFRFAPGRGDGRRVQLAVLFVVGLLLALPAAASTGLTKRATTTESSDDPSGIDHLDALRDGLSALRQHPLGQGLGTSAGTGQRFQQARVISENNYIQVGNELGVVALAVFAGLTLVAIQKLRRAVLKSHDLALSAVWCAAVGLAIGALFLHTWNDFAVAWTLWALVGAVLGAAARGAAEKRGGDPLAAAARVDGDDGGRRRSSGRAAVRI